MRPEAASFAKREKMEKIINTLSVLLRKSFMPESPPPSLPGHRVLRTEKISPVHVFPAVADGMGFQMHSSSHSSSPTRGLNVRIA
jgi:hypothetical protein